MSRIKIDLKPIAEIPENMLAMKVPAFFTLQRFLAIGLSAPMANRIRNVLSRYEKYTMREFVKVICEQRECLLENVPGLGPVCLQHIILAVNAS